MGSVEADGTAGYWKLDDSALRFVTMRSEMCPTPSDKVFLPLEDWHALLPRLRYGCVEMRDATSPLAYGNMTIGDDLRSPSVWVAWSWTEMEPGVVVQQDLQGVRSNVCILDACGIPLTSMGQFQALQTVMYRLSWWRHVDLEWFRHGRRRVRRMELPPAQ